MNKNVNIACKVDYENKNITVSKEFLRKAGKVGSPEYIELLAAQKDHPDYPIVIRITKKPDTQKPNISYKKMEKFFETFPNAKVHRAAYEKVKSLSHIQPSPYNFVRNWFLATYYVQDINGNYMLNPAIVPVAVMQATTKALDAPAATICLPAV